MTPRLSLVLQCPHCEKLVDLPLLPDDWETRARTAEALLAQYRAEMERVSMLGEEDMRQVLASCAQREAALTVVK